MQEWKPRTHEDKLLLNYYQSKAGILVLEVPIGSSKVWPVKSKIRRIDGIRIPNALERILRFTEVINSFDELIKGQEIELIEVKVKLNRLVIGQIIAGIDMFEREYNHSNIRPIIVCSEGDPALEWVCKKRGIEVVIY